MSYEIFNEDCLEAMKRIPDGSVDMIATDPPYCVGVSLNGLKSSFSDFNLMRPFWEQCFNEWRRVLKDGGHVYCCTDWRTYPFLYPIIIKYFCVKNLIVWEHLGIRPGNWYRGSYELIIFATMGSGSTGVACMNTGRNFIGFEKEKNFYDISQKRIDEAIAKREQSLF